MKDFWTRQENKISFQNFFVNHCCNNYTSLKPLYIAGGLHLDPEKCTLIVEGNISEAKCYYRASHEEVDDRIMFSIQQVYQQARTPPTLTVVTSDTDIFAVLMYHLKTLG